MDNPFKSLDAQVKPILEIKEDINKVESIVNLRDVGDAGKFVNVGDLVNTGNIGNNIGNAENILPQNINKSFEDISTAESIGNFSDVGNVGKFVNAGDLVNTGNVGNNIGSAENILSQNISKPFEDSVTKYQQYETVQQQLQKLAPSHKSAEQATEPNSQEQPGPEAYTFGDITYKLPVELNHITKLRMVQTLNDHVTIFIEGQAPDTLEAKDIESVSDKAAIELNLKGRAAPLFAGLCTGISLKYEAGLRTVEIEGKSWTYEFDITKKSRSFQKLGISYKDFINEVLKDYPQKAFINCLPDSQKYNRFAVQYWETDWAFLKRIAAREGTVLVAEYADAHHQPRFWLGLPKPPAKPLTATAEQTTSCDHRKYLQVVSNHEDSVQEQDFMTYETIGYEVFPLGDTVEYAGQTLTITHIVTTLDKGLIKNTYTLANSEKMAVANAEHSNLKGVSLPGKILNCRGVNSKIHLNIDANQDEATAIWFPYANDTGNVFYCMPHQGETISLYFKDGYEENAIAVNGARKNGGNCQKTGDYNNRYFTNHERKELFLSPDTVSFTVDEQAAEKIAIKMNDQGGITIESTKDITLSGQRTITFEGKAIIMESAKPIDAAGGSA